MKTPLLAAAVLTCLPSLAPASVSTGPAIVFEARAEADPPANATGPYADGMRALNQQRWPDAVTAFSRAASAHGKNADAALYWKAYSLNKLNKPNLVAATCSQLHAAYSTSSWNRDCSALSLQLQLDPNSLPNSAEIQKLVADSKNIHVNLPELYIDMPHAEQADPDADLKILALNSLMNRDPAQALPILRHLLTTPQPAGIKQHALFILEQNNSPEAQQLLHEIVLGHIDPSLQREAVQMMGVTEGKRANETLDQLYRSTSDPQIKEAVLNAFFVSGDAPRMVDLARQEKDLNRKREIVSRLALMQDKAATDYMLELLK